MPTSDDEVQAIRDEIRGLLHGRTVTFEMRDAMDLSLIFGIAEQKIAVAMTCPCERCKSASVLSSQLLRSIRAMTVALKSAFSTIELSCEPELKRRVLSMLLSDVERGEFESMLETLDKNSEVN